MKFPTIDFFSKCDQIHSLLRIWSHLLKKSLMENIVFFAVNIANISLKQLPSRIETKQQLTVYLSEYVISEFKRLGKDYVVIYDSISRTNQECLSTENLHHSHEEVDTLLIMHCWEIVITNPVNQCIVYSPDTDVFLLLIFHYPSLPKASIFCTGS